MTPVNLLKFTLRASLFIVFNLPVVFAAQAFRGTINKVIVSNDNNMTPGFSICVLTQQQSSQQEMCLWRHYNSFNYNQLLNAANMALLANKEVEIKANIVGDLDSIVILNK